MLTIFAFMTPIINALMYLVVATILLAGSYQVGSSATTPGVITGSTSRGKTTAGYGSAIYDCIGRVGVCRALF